MSRIKSAALAVCLLGLSLLAVPTAALDLDEIFIGVVEDREQDANLVYVFVLSLFGEDIAGGRVYKPGNPTPICELELDSEFLGFDATCNILGTSVADLCAQFGFGDFFVEIDAAPGGTNDTVTLSFDPGCADVFPGNVDITSPTTGADVLPLPDANTFCFDCTVPGGCADFWQMETYDDFGNFDSVEFITVSSTPACWDVASCLPQGTNYTFRASSIHLFGENVPNFTDSGDAFAETSFYQNANLDYFNVLGGGPTTPSAIPSGTGATFPTIADKLDASGSSLIVYWDSFSCCGNTNTQLVHGTSADLPAALGGTYSLDGSECALGTDGEYVWAGTPNPAAGDFVWWLVVSNDGTDTEGSWGLDSSGLERLGPGISGVSLQCGMTSKDSANTCGR